MWDKPVLLNWIANFFYALATVLLVYGVIYVVVHLPIFPLREVRVDGQLDHVTREQVKLIVERHLRGNFFTLDLVKARDAFQKLPWARNVAVAGVGHVDLIASAKVYPQLLEEIRAAGAA